MSRVQLQNIPALTFYKDPLTAARRSDAIPQLSCIGKAYNRYQPEAIRCTNVGGLRYEVDWKVCWAIWSMTGRLSMNNQNGHFSKPSNLRWRSPQRSIMDPPACLRYPFNHYLPSIVTNTANSDSSRLVYRRHEVVMIS